MKLSAIIKLSVISIALFTASIGSANNQILPGAVYPGPIKILPKICTKGGSASVLIRSVDLGDGYHANILLNGKPINAYCETGDCALLYNYGIKNIKAKVKLGYTYMEEYESTKTCTIEDIELTPDQKIWDESLTVN